MGTLYESDFVEWSARTAELLRERRFEEVDLENLVEEVQDLGTSWQRAVGSHLRRMLKHLIKQKIQPERDGTNWRGSIANAQIEICSYLEDAPSLRRYLAGILQETWRQAIRQALIETGLESEAKDAVPGECPYTADDILEADLPALAAKLR